MKNTMTKKERWKKKHQEFVSQLYTNGKITEKVIPAKEDVLPNDTNKQLSKARCISKTQIAHLRERYHFQRYTMEEWNAFVTNSYKQEWGDLFQENVMTFSEDTSLVERDYWFIFRWSQLLAFDGDTPLKDWERLIDKFKVAHLYAKHLFLPHDVTKFGVSMCAKVYFELNNDRLTKELKKYDGEFVVNMMNKYLKNTKHINKCHYTQHITWMNEQHRKLYQPTDWKDVRKLKSWYGKRKV